SPADTTDPISALVAGTGDASTTPLPEPEPLEVAAVAPADATPTVFDASLVAPIPMPRPADRASMVGSASGVREANAAGALAPAQLPLVDLTDDPPATTSAVSSRGGAYVQLSSQKTEADAQASLRATQNRMGSVLNGASLEIRRVDLGAKGVWYRVVLPRDSFQDATQTCAAIESNGWDCVAIGGQRRLRDMLRAFPLADRCCRRRSPVMLDALGASGQKSFLTWDAAKMTEATSDWFEAPGPAPDDEVLYVDVAGYEGPLDLLLDLARRQKVDLARISVLALAEQYLAFIETIREKRIEIAADYLVMAAWLAYLKSRLMVPSTETDEEPSGEMMAALLQFRLKRLEAMRDAAMKLMNRSRLGIS